MDTLSFQGHTTLICNPKKYNEVFQSSVRRSRDLKPLNKQCIRPNYEYTSSSLDNNMIVIVRDDKKGFLKFVPITANNENILNDIAKKVDELLNASKEGIQNMTAWIIGGNPIQSQRGTLMVETLNKIANILCDKPNIDTSILAGSKNIQENLVILPHRNDFELILEKEKGTKLEDIFDIVELNNTDII